MFDSDDILKTNSLAELYEVAMMFADCQVVQGGHDVMFNNTDVSAEVNIKPSYLNTYRQKYSKQRFTHNEYWSKVLHEHMFSTNILFKRTFLIENNIRYDETQCYLEDAAFWINLLSCKPTCVFSGISTYVYRYNIPTSASGSPISDKKIMSIISVSQAVKNHVNNFSEEAGNIVREYAENMAISAFVSTSTHGKDRDLLMKYLVCSFPKIHSKSSMKNKIVSSMYNCSPMIACRIINSIYKVLKK